MMNDRLKGKVCMVTGATSGIGKETALALANQGATLVVAGRSSERLKQTISDIKERSNNASVDGLLADLSSMQEVRKLAQEFQERYEQLHVLVNNAGLFLMQRETTVDGYDKTFATNHLSYFLLTNLLLDTIKASAPARIVNVSSRMHDGAKIDFEDLHNEKNYQGMKAYGRSKLGNIMFTYELARRLKDTQVTVNCLHPGGVATGIGGKSGFLVKLLWALGSIFMKSPADGAKTSIYLASSPEVEGVSGEYFVNEKYIRSSKESYDEEMQARLWDISLELTGL